MRHILKCASDNDMAAKRAAFLAASDRLREKTNSHRQTPAEVLTREDRDRGFRENFLSASSLIRPWPNLNSRS